MDIKVEALDEESVSPLPRQKQSLGSIRGTKRLSISFVRAIKARKRNTKALQSLNMPIVPSSKPKQLINLKKSSFHAKPMNLHYFKRISLHGKSLRDDTTEQSSKPKELNRIHLGKALNKKLKAIHHENREFNHHLKVKERIAHIIQHEMQKNDKGLHSTSVLTNKERELMAFKEAGAFIHKRLKNANNSYSSQLDFLVEKLKGKDIVHITHRNNEISKANSLHQIRKSQFIEEDRQRELIYQLLDKTEEMTLKIRKSCADTSLLS